METDWKKKYEEALRLAKSYYGKGQNEFLDTLFPELAESEDEKIRKRLVEYFKGFYDRFSSRNNVNVHWEGLEVKKVIAYLEKQKTSEESIRYVKENHSPDEVSDFQAAMNIAVAKAYDKGVKDTLEKQKAKERLDRMAPIYNDKESFESALEKAWKYYNESASRKVDSFEDDYIECVFSKGFREGFLYREKQKEQKPWKVGANAYFTPEQKPAEWSDEDEKILNLAIEWAETMSGQFSFVDMNPTDFRKIIAWLEFLKNRGNFPKSNTNSPIKEGQR